VRSEFYCGADKRLVVKNAGISRFRSDSSDGKLHSLIEDSYLGWYASLINSKYLGIGRLSILNELSVHKAVNIRIPYKFVASFCSTSFGFT
jgi:hypothetical protein